MNDAHPRDSTRRLHVLTPGEQLDVEVNGVDRVLSVTDQRIIVSDGRRVALELPYSGLRRVQFDVERSMTGTLVIVPDSGLHEPQVLSIPVDELLRAGTAVALIGQRLG
jgi:hypothetical protein